MQSRMRAGEPVRVMLLRREMVEEGSGEEVAVERILRGWLKL